MLGKYSKPNSEITNIIPAIVSWKQSFLWRVTVITSWTSRCWTVSWWLSFDGWTFWRCTGT